MPLYRNPEFWPSAAEKLEGSYTIVRAGSKSSGIAIKEDAVIISDKASTFGVDTKKGDITYSTRFLSPEEDDKDKEKPKTLKLSMDNPRAGWEVHTITGGSFVGYQEFSTRKIFGLFFDGKGVIVKSTDGTAYPTTADEGFLWTLAKQAA